VPIAIAHDHRSQCAAADRAPWLPRAPARRSRSEEPRRRRTRPHDPHSPRRHLLLAALVVAGLAGAAAVPAQDGPPPSPANERLRLPAPTIRTFVDPRGGFSFTDPGRLQSGEAGRVFHVDARWRVRTVCDNGRAPTGSSCAPAGASRSSPRACTTASCVSRSAPPAGSAGHACSPGAFAVPGASSVAVLSMGDRKSTDGG